MKNKIMISAVSAIMLGTLTTTQANLLLNSSQIDLYVSNGYKIPTAYNLALTTSFKSSAPVSKVSNIAAPVVQVLNKVQDTTVTVNSKNDAEHPIPFAPGIALYTTKKDSLAGILNVTFTASVGAKTFHQSYDVGVDADGNLAALDELPPAQNGLVCEFISQPGDTTNPRGKIEIQCQDLMQQK